MGYGNTANPVNLAYGYKPNSGVTQYLQNIANVSTQCSGTDKVYNVSIIGGVLSIECATDQTGGASSSYNSTYDKWAYNQTAPAISWVQSQNYLTSYTETDPYYNRSWNETRANLLYSTIIWGYNQTTATFNQYGTQWYNHTLSVETLYGKWFYNMTSPFSNWLATFVYNYNQTSSAINTFGVWGTNGTKLHITNITGIINTSRCDATTGKLINVTFNNGILQGECATDQTGAGGGATTIYKTESDISTVGLTFSTLYTIPLTANKNYTIDCYMLHSSNITTSGIRYNMSLAGVPDYMTISMSAMTTATAAQASVVRGASISLMPTAVTASLAYPNFLNDEINIFIDGNANTGGNAIFQYSGELASLNATVGKGSYCKPTEVS